MRVIILVRVTSVLWFLLKSDWNSPRILFSLEREFICTEKIISSILQMNGRLGIGLCSSWSVHYCLGWVSLLGVLEQLIWRHLGRCLIDDKEMIQYSLEHLLKHPLKNALGTVSLHELEELHSVTVLQNWVNVIQVNFSHCYIVFTAFVEIICIYICKSTSTWR